MTTEQFKNKIHNINPNIEIIGEYISWNDKIECKCCICNNTWYPVPSNLARGYKCPTCNRINRRLTHSEFLTKLKTVNTNVKILSQYTTYNEHVLAKCNTCGHEWSVKPANLMSGKGCPQCGYKKNAEKQRKSHAQFIKELSKIDNSIFVLDTYVNAKHKLNCRCLKCNHIWNVSPDNLLLGTGCPKCRILQRAKNRTKTHLEFCQQLSEINPNITLVSEYKKAKESIHCKCNICEFSWKTTPTDLLSSRNGCPACSSSYGEQTISNFLNYNSIEFVYQKKYDDLIGTGGGKLSYDFYLPNCNLLVEYQGQFHDGSVSFQTKESYNKQRKHDKLKKNTQHIIILVY